MNWEDAQAFCAWLTERERKAGKLDASERYRLPTDHEWSCAAGIGEMEDAAVLPSEKAEKIKDVYPWGTQWPPPAGAGNYGGEEMRPVLAAGKYPWLKDVIAGYSDGFVETAPVGSFPANRFGLFDMGGNVSQWCEDRWSEKDQKYRVLRGASWFYLHRGAQLTSARDHYDDGFKGVNLGFRCVLAPTAGGK